MGEKNNCVVLKYNSVVLKYKGMFDMCSMEHPVMERIRHYDQILQEKIKHMKTFLANINNQ